MSDEAQIDNITLLKVGDTDNYGVKVIDIIDSVEDEYIIYFTDDSYIDAHFINTDECTYSLSPAYEKSEAELYSLDPDNNYFNKFIRESVGRAKSQELRDNREAAMSILESVKSRYIRKCKSRDFKKHLFVAGLPIVAIAYIFISPIDIITSNAIIYNALLCIEFSALGDMLYQLKKIDIDYKQYKRYNPKQGFLTFIQAAISGIIIYTIIYSKLFLGNFLENTAAIMVISFISGYNENLILVILKKITDMIMPKESESDE